MKKETSENEGSEGVSITNKVPVRRYLKSVCLEVESQTKNFWTRFYGLYGKLTILSSHIFHVINDITLVSYKR